MSETGNGRKNWTRVVAAVGLVFWQLQEELFWPTRTK